MASHSLSTDARQKAADQGYAMKDLSFPIRDRRELAKAIKAFGRARDSKKPMVKAHIRKRAKALGATDLLPDSWK